MKDNKFLSVIAAAAVVLVLGVAANAIAQGQGYGYGHGTGMGRGIGYGHGGGMGYSGMGYGTGMGTGMGYGMGITGEQQTAMHDVMLQYREAKFESMTAVQDARYNLDTLINSDTATIEEIREARTQLTEAQDNAQKLHNQIFEDIKEALPLEQQESFNQQTPGQQTPGGFGSGPGWMHQSEGGLN